MKDAAPKSAIQDQIIEAFSFRHATKVFDAEAKIPEEQFATILEAGRLSPSSFGMEPWQILVIQSPEKRELFRPFSWGASGVFNGTAGQLGTASHFVVFLAHTGATMSHESDYPMTHAREVKQLPEEALEGFNAAYAKFQKEDFRLDSDREITNWSARQAYIALGNMMTAAAFMEIDSCPIEGFDAGEASAVLEEHFGIDPKLCKPAVMAAFGYRAGPPMFPKTRRSLENTVSWF